MDKAVPVSTFATGDIDLPAFLKVGETKHSCHKPFLLVIYSRDTQYVFSFSGTAQQDMAEALVTIKKKSVIAQSSLSPAETAAV